MMCKARWERHENSAYMAIPIAVSEAEEVRSWCAENCRGDYLVNLGREVLFELREDAALAALWWWKEDD
jgi:hypothetical protein